PYFMAYEVSENESDTMEASQGSLQSQSHDRGRYLDVTVRVGARQFDNYRMVGNQNRPRFTAATSIALEDNPASIRQTVWLATDRTYRAASQRLIQLKADEKLRAQAEDGSDDFDVEKPEVFASAPAKIKFNANEWAARLRKLSAEFSQFPGALNSSIQLQSELVTTTLVNTEGSRLQHGRPFARLIIVATGKAADGMDLSTMESFETDD